MKKKLFLFSSFVLLMILIIGGILYLFLSYIPQKKEEIEREQLVKEYYENKLILYESENNKYNDYEVDVVFLGDSLTDGYNLNLYYPEYIVSNRGIAGETTIGLEDRLNVSVLELVPKVVVMLIGGNNLDSMFDNYEDILIKFKNELPNTKVILLSLTAMGQEWKHKNELACFNNVKIKLLSEKFNYTFVDLYSPLLDLNTNEIYSEYTIDGAHLTDIGYEVITQIIKPIIQKELENF